MKQVPYHDNPGNACALACYTMIAQYLLPDAGITFEQLGKIASWRKDYVVWEFPIWKWLMDRGIHITDYDVIDYDAWSKEGITGLKNSIPPEEFKWYQENTYDLDAVTGHIQQAFMHPNFTYVRKKATWNDVVVEYEKPGICDIVLNSRVLNDQGGFAAHRVVLIEITDKEVIFHDPNYDGSGKYRHEPIGHFRKALENIESPALARYSLDPTPEGHQIDAFITALPDWQRELCTHLRQLIHQAEPSITETIKRGDRPYFVLQGNICALQATRDHINVFIYDPIAPDPHHIINQGQDNQTARSIQVYQNDQVDAEAFKALITTVANNNRAGGWRKLKVTRS